MNYRHRSLWEFGASFFHVDPRAWYRPLAQRSIISILYPLVGLSPMAYRIAGFALFFVCTVAVFLAVRQLTSTLRTAWLATLVFATNVTHAFTTYDVAYFPEMLFALFCIGSMMAFAANRRILAAILFSAALLSKETAVALPIAMTVAWALLPKKDGRSWKSLDDSRDKGGAVSRIPSAGPARMSYIRVYDGFRQRRRNFPGYTERIRGASGGRTRRICGAIHIQLESSCGSGCAGSDLPTVGLFHSHLCENHMDRRDRIHYDPAFPEMGAVLIRNCEDCPYPK
jgi:hypothetical protein